MEPNQNIALLTTTTDLEDVKVIEWEDFEHDLVRLASLSSALNEAKEKKRNLQQKLEGLIQVNAESLGRLNELEEMRQKLESKKMMMENMSIRSRLAKEDAGKQEEQLSGAVQSLLVAGGTLSVTNRNLQESSRLLSEENGYVRLRNLQKILRMRQQYMTSQISMLYPVKIFVGPAQEQELEAYPLGSPAGTPPGPKPVNQGSLTIQGLQLTMQSFRKMSFFTDKKEIQRSATALGYVAHAVSLVASCLQVPLRYPLRLGASHSYIIDNAPSVELTSSEASSSVMSSTNGKHVEFPLFLEGQDTTRAAYAVFLLNKMSMASLGQAGKRKFPDAVDDDDDIDYVTFSIRGQDGRQLYFKVNQDTALIKVFRKYCERVSLEYETMRFLLDDSYVKGERQTPKMLNMENGAEIFAARQQSGGGGAALSF